MRDLLGAEEATPAMWSWTADDPTLPPAEHYRVRAWLTLHGFDQSRTTAACVLGGHGWRAVEVDLAVALPAGEWKTHRRRVALRYPPPVPWTAAMRRAA